VKGKKKKGKEKGSCLRRKERKSPRRPLPNPFLPPVRPVVRYKTRGGGKKKKGKGGKEEKKNDKKLRPKIYLAEGKREAGTPRFGRGEKGEKKGGKNRARNPRKGGKARYYCRSRNARQKKKKKKGKGEGRKKGDRRAAGALSRPAGA